MASNNCFFRLRSFYTLCPLPLSFFSSFCHTSRPLLSLTPPPFITFILPTLTLILILSPIPFSRIPRPCLSFILCITFSPCVQCPSLPPPRCNKNYPFFRIPSSSTSSSSTHSPWSSARPFSGIRYTPQTCITFLPMRFKTTPAGQKKLHSTQNGPCLFPWLAFLVWHWSPRSLNGHATTSHTRASRKRSRMDKRPLPMENPPSTMLF